MITLSSGVRDALAKYVVTESEFMTWWWMINPADSTEQPQPWDVQDFVYTRSWTKENGLA